MKIWEKKLTRTRVAVILFVLAIIIAGFFWFFLLLGGSDRIVTSSFEQSNEEKTIRYPSRLNGEETGSATRREPKAVMIDNHPDAYPLSGLADARVVYETQVEGGITRYMAMFDSDQEVAKVGPVRSARPYYLDWVSEYGASLYMYCGGSPQALRQITEKNIFAVNQFYNDPYFWRDDSKKAPHNLYTNAGMWNDYLSRQLSDNQVSSWESWKFSSGCVMASSTYVAGMKLVFNADYDVSWRYNIDAGVYERQVNGVPHLDDKEKNITASDIVIQFAPTKVIDEIGRKEIGVIGSGDAIFLQCGKLAPATWQKESLVDRTRYFDAGGQEIFFKPGKIWIEVAPLGARTEFIN